MSLSGSVKLRYEKCLEVWGNATMNARLCGQKNPRCEILVETIVILEDGAWKIALLGS